LLHGYVETRGLGTVLVEAGFVVSRRPDTVRGPDISFVSRTRLAPEQIPEAFIPFAPDLAVEILSPDDRAAEIEEKVGDYLGGGTRVVWVVDPGCRSVTVHRADRAPEVKRGLDRLDGENVVPGFECSVADLFGSRSGPSQGNSG
jgi:Uma2 family endonuclease